MTDPSPKPERRWFQFSLRTLFIVTTLVAILFAWLGWWSYKARQQREAVAALEKVGAHIWYTSRMKNPPKWPKWVLEFIDKDYVRTVHVLLLPPDTKDIGSQMEHIKVLTALQYLALHDTQVTDTSLEHLKDLTALQILDVSNTKVTDSGIEHFKDLTALQKLWLHNTQVTDSGLEHLKGLTALQYLDLRKTQVTDAGVARLQQSLPNCQIDH